MPVSERFDEKQLESLFRAHYDGLCRFALGYVKRQDIAGELVQEAFISLWENRDRIDPSGKVKSYLSTAVRNKCLNHLRDTRKYSGELLSIENLPGDSGYDPPDQFAVRDLKDRIDRAISELPEKCREVFILNREKSLKYQQIADHLGISVKTVETQMSKALQHLRTRLADYLPVLILVLLASAWIFIFFSPSHHFTISLFNIRVTAPFGV